MTSDEAISIGQDALIWLAGQPEDLQRFLAASGTSSDMFRTGASNPEFLGFVLEFLLGSDALIVDFSSAAGIRPEQPLQARMALSGGELPNWT